jgi:hypothetical protein
LILFFLLCLSVLGQEKKDAENVHTIIQGETLWEISSKFLNDPFLWPKLWQMNPYIANPHWIYPGQSIQLSAPEKLKEEKPQEVVVEEKPKEVVVEAEVKKEELPPTEKEGPSQIEKKAEVIAETKPMEKNPEVYPEVGSAGFVGDIGFRGIGIILDSKEGKQLMSQGDIAYLAFRTSKPIMIGDKFTVFRASEAVRHPVTGQKIGKKYSIIGNIQVIDQYGNFFTGRVIESFDAIYKGDMLKPYM